MKRRDLVRGGLGLLTLGAVGPSWGARPCPPNLFGASNSSCGSPGPGTGPRPLETLSSQMSSGTWAQLSSDGNGFKSLSQYNGGSPPRSALEYANQVFWNSSAKELHFRGGGASSGGGNAQRHLRYNDSAGTWDAVTPWHTNWAHQWSNFTGDPSTGDLYFRQRNSTNTVKWSYQAYPVTVSSWSTHSSGGFDGNYDAQCLEFFPDLNSGAGGLVFIGTYGNDCSVWVTDANLTTWTPYLNIYSPAKIEIFAAYLPSQQLVMFGGGNQGPDIAVMDASRNFTKLNDSPEAFGTGGHSKGTVVGHPNGRVFAVSALHDEIWEWSGLGNDTWTSRGTLPYTANWLSACAIADFDVIYCLIQTASAGTAAVEEWLYKL